MKRTKHNSKYFYGHEISAYGQERGYLDYRTLAQAFDAVLVNDITKLFYSTVNGDYSEPEQVNGYIDNSDAIEELNDKAEQLFDKQYLLDENSAEWEQIENEIENIKEQIEELEREQDEQPEIFQYYIVSDSGAEILQYYTDDPVYYLPLIDCYLWGVTHYGTAWDYVLTNVKLNLED